SPDLLAIEEIQDNDGAANSGTTDASVTWTTLLQAIRAAGGPRYRYRQIDPLNDADGDMPGANIRVGFLYRTDRGLAFVDRPGGDRTSPARADPRHPAWSTPEGVRRPLAGEFRARGHTLFVVANHWKSKNGDHP